MLFGSVLIVQILAVMLMSGKDILKQTAQRYIVGLTEIEQSWDKKHSVSMYIYTHIHIHRQIYTYAHRERQVEREDISKGSETQRCFPLS